MSYGREAEAPMSIECRPQILWRSILSPRLGAHKMFVARPDCFLIIVKHEDFIIVVGLRRVRE